jgi:hypothetical protein
MTTKGPTMWRSKLVALLVPVLLVAFAPRAHADDAAEEKKRAAEEQREREREKEREARERAREEAQRAREEAQRQREEAQERAREEQERAREQAQRAREEGQRARHEHDDDEGNGKKSGRTSAKVKGPVRFSVDVVNADVQVTAAGKDTVTLAAKNCAPDDLELDGDGDEFEADFNEWGSCEGPVVVVVPLGSSVEVTTVQGSLKLKGSYKEVEASSVAGSIEVDAGDDVRVEAVQGKVRVGSARRVQVESVAGDVDIVTTGIAPIVSVETVNGNVRWSGACGKGCRASIESFQGSSTFTLDGKTSSFELRFSTESGKLNDGMGTQSSNGKNVKGYTPSRTRYGKGEGTIRVETYQGDLNLKKK